MQRPHELTGGDGDDGAVDGRGEDRGPRVEVDRRLAGDPVALFGDGREQLGQRAGVLDAADP